MKRKFFLIMWMSFFIYYSIGQSFADEAFKTLTLRITTEQRKYLLGEPAVIKIELSNTTSEPIIAHTDISPLGGGLMTVYISPIINSEFKKYIGHRWGLSERKPTLTKILPNTTLHSEAFMLYHHIIKGDMASLQTYYAFPKVGRYWIKANLYDIDFKTKIESIPIEIEIAEPIGVDAKIWGIMESDINLAYFLHTGDPRKSLDVVAKCEEIIKLYPESTYSKYIKDALDRYYSKFGK